MTGQTAVDRIPIAHSVRYAAHGLPDVPNQYGPGVLRPSEITLTYRAAPDSQLGRVHAYVAGRIWVDGTELSLLPGGLYGQHYDDGLDGWPAWLADEARLHDPAALAFAADRAALHDRIARALAEVTVGHKAFITVDVRAEYPRADAVLSVLPAPADGAAVLREAVLREAADAITKVIEADRAYSPRRSNDRAALGGAREIVLNLIDTPRRVADETQQPETPDVVAAIVAALQERARELSELAEEQMRPRLEERAQEWLEAAEMARRAAKASAAAPAPFTPPAAGAQQPKEEA